VTELAPSPSQGERPALRRRRRPSRLGWIALLLIATALLIRLAYVEATPGYQLVHDARDYDTHARSIAAGEGYSKHLLYDRPTAFRPPGYPYFLGGVYRLAGVERAEAGRRIRAARIAQALVGTAAVALLGLLAAQLWGPRVGLLALALGAVYVPLILVGGSVMSEPLFVVLMLAALAAAVHHRGSVHRYRFAILAGVLGGLAILTRANALVLLGPLAFAAWDARPRLSRRALGPPVALVVAALLTVAPWTARNAIVLDSFIPVSTQLGSALAGTYNDAARTDRENPASWRSVKRVPDYTHLLRQARETPEPVLERRLREASLDYIAEHPFYVFKVGWWSTLRMLDLAGRDWSRHTASTISVDRDWADAGVICFWIFALLALAGALTGRARRAPAFLWVVPALMFLSVVFLVVETPRYRSAIDPFVVLLAGLALTGGLARARRVRPAGLRRRAAGPPDHRYRFRPLR
jgi:4-amino-4-deoxy-L-arabinose transferase-like glycosyltransferase